MSSENIVAAAKNAVPLVSIIVPFYNTEAYFRKCLQALVGQTYKNIEILLIDDASTDGGLKIAGEFAAKDKRIRILNQEMTPPLTDKIGVAKARNLGLDCARGKYIMFCDSDDWYEPNMVELMVKAMEENPEADLASCSAAVHQIDWKDADMESYLLNREKGILSFDTTRKIREAAVVWNKIFRKSIFDHYTIRCREAKEQGSDENISGKYFLVSQKIYYITDKLYNYVLRCHSLMGTNHSDKIGRALRYLENLHDIINFAVQWETYQTNSAYFAAKFDSVIFTLRQNTAGEGNRPSA